MSPVLKERDYILFCFAGPGASGKSTICRELAKEKNLRLSISTTTRAPRAGEKDGQEYYFIGQEEFSKRIKEGQFVEYASFGSQWYGTEKKNFELAEQAGQDVLLDIDVQGVKSLKASFAPRVVTIFIMPPSWQILEERFLSRGADSPEQIKRRLETAREEVRILSEKGFSDYLLLNDSLDQAILSARSIIAAEKLKLGRYCESFLATLKGT